MDLAQTCPKSHCAMMLAIERGCEDSNVRSIFRLLIVQSVSLIDCSLQGRISVADWYQHLADQPYLESQERGINNNVCIPDDVKPDL
jgi:hypothetical protein